MTNAVFNYVEGQHDVYQVTQDTYRSCDTSTGVIKTYKSGSDRITLKEAQRYWFICNVSGHCLGGMKFGVNVKASNATTQPTQQPNPISPTSEPTPANGVGSILIHNMKGWKWVFNLVAFWTLVLLNSTIG